MSRILIIGTFVALLMAGIFLLKAEKPALVTPEVRVERASPAGSPGPVEAGPTLEALAVGATLEWRANEMPDELLRRAGPYRIRILKAPEDDRVAPIVELSSAGRTVRMKGEAVSPGFTHKISVVQLSRGETPVVMLQSFSGGAHCCNSLQLAGLFAGELKIIELGSWDGDEIPLPTDISNDGVADFRFWDNSFLYTFASYASSHAPPVILNVVKGKVIDVSREPAFHALYAETVKEAGEVCRSGEPGDQRNGACPAYVAAAARIGKLDEAWRRMLAAHDATTGWDFPTGCRVATPSGCPKGQEISFKSYAEALLHFLKERAYITKDWVPPTP